MIEKFNFENDTDVASILGKTTLIAGSSYGLYKTFSDLPKVIDAGYFRRSMGRFSNIPALPKKSVSTLSSNVGFSSFFSGTKLPKTFATANIQSIDELKGSLGLLSGGYKGRSKGLSQEIFGLHSDLMKRFDDVRTKIYTGAAGVPEMVRLQAGNLFFDIPTVSQEGLMRLSTKSDQKYVARSALKSYDLASGKVEIEGLDVSLTRKYREELGRITSGKITPKDIKRLATDKAIWETTRGVRDLSKTNASALQELRKEQVVADVFGGYTTKARTEILKDISSIKGYSGGSAGMFAKGVFATPESLLSRGLPGAESSISAYQFVRPSEFTGTKKSSINWTPGLDAGTAQFKIATINDKESFKRAMKKTGLSIGELADEEAILAKGMNVGIKNKMYNFNIDLEKQQTKFMQGLLRDVYESAEKRGLDPRQVSVAMSGGTANKAIQQKLTETFEGVDLNKKYQRLQSREMVLAKEIDLLKSKKSTLVMGGERGKDLSKIEKQLTGKYKGLDQIREAMKNFGILGYDETGQAIKVPTGDTRNVIRNISRTGTKLSIATESHYQFGVGSKLFTGGGGGKWTIKSEANVPLILGWMEAEKIYGNKASEIHAKDLSKAFQDVQMISAEAPIKIKQGTLAPREGMTAIMSYATGIMGSGTPEEIKRLEEIGIKSGEFTGTKLSGKEIISKISSWHGNKTLDQIFGGEEFLSSKVTEMIMAPDISSSQAGIGRTGTLSDRAAFNLQSMGLGDVLEETLSKRKAGFSPFAQLQELETAKAIAGDPGARGRALEGIVPDIDRLFQSDIGARKKFMEGQDRLTISLGKKLAGIEKVTVFASDIMTPYIGEGKGGPSQLDKATKDLLLSISKGEDESFQIAKAKKYQSVVGQVEESVSGNLFKAKIKGSMYGQAVSSLEGMDVAAAELGKKMGLTDNIQAPLIAMSKADIKRKFGIEAMKQAVEGNLWGIMTREPIEGTHSVLPVNIRAAEDFGVPGKLEGAVYISGEDQAKSMIRRSMFVDFDKDTVNVIAATSDKASQQIQNFYGLGGKAQTASGAEFLSSLKRMSAFELKGREPLSITDLMNDELIALNTSQKHLEKGLIGSFSNEFKNIHIGLREQLRPKMGRGAAEAYYLGEDFSHLFVENILKAKHQRKESLIAGSVEDTLDILRGTVGTKYSEMGKGEKATELQRIFDELTFGNKEIASSVRGSEEAIVGESLAERMGFAKDLANAKKIERAEESAAEVSSILDRATKQREAFKKISSMENLGNIIEAHTIGREVQQAGDYSSGIAARMISTQKTMAGRLQDITQASSKMMTKGLKNVAKYGILPTAAIGLMASLTTKPKILQPSLDTGRLHESESRKFVEPESVPMGKTIFSLPDSKISAFDVSGATNRSTDFEALRTQSLGRLKSGSMTLRDQRSHMDKYTVQEMITKGH